MAVTPAFAFVERKLLLISETGSVGICIKSKEKINKYKFKSQKI